MYNYIGDQEDSNLEKVTIMLSNYSFMTWSLIKNGYLFGVFLHHTKHC